MEMSMMRKVMMDIAVPQMTGGPLASSVEECVCPPQYSGASCEECSEGHTREEGGTCVSPEDREREPPSYNPRVRPMIKDITARIALVQSRKVKKNINIYSSS